jgi:hypothetical protein
MRTATETLVNTMEEFGRAEPEDCIIIWTDANGDICWSSTTNSKVIRLGMIETVKALILSKVDE